MTLIPHTPPLPRLLALGESAWTIEFGDTIDRTTHRRVLGLARRLGSALAAGELPGVVEWVPTFRSLTLHVDPLAAAEDLGARVLALAIDVVDAGGDGPDGRRWILPVCFEADCAPDLDAVAAACGRSAEAVQALLTGCVLTVYMLGFLPGFPYLGGLPDVLSVPRLTTPRRAVPARSIAIAGGSCAVYPWESPGGWRLVGRTPVRLFDAGNAARPALLAPGDEVRWQAIDAAAYARLDLACARGEFDLQTLLDAPPAGASAP